MPTDDLSAIAGLEDKHLRVLAIRLQITTFRALVFADRRAIFRAMNHIRPRPTLEQIARWQDQARSELSEPAVDPSDWHPAASFAVIFAQRQVEGVWERQLRAERTEVEPELVPAVWPGWDCTPICGWMLAQLEQQGGRDGRPSTGGTTGEDQAGLTDEMATSTTPPVTRERLRITSAAVISAAGRADLIREGELVAKPPIEMAAPVRMVLTVIGAQPGREVCAIARLRAHSQPEWSSEEPVTTDRSGRADLNLCPVTAGQHEVKLLAWAADATAYPVSVRLPTVTIRPAVNTA